MESMSQIKDNLRAAVRERFTAVAASPDREQKFPVGPASTKKLGYEPQAASEEPDRLVVVVDDQGDGRDGLAQRAPPSRDPSRSTRTATSHSG